MILLTQVVRIDYVLGVDGIILIMILVGGISHIRKMNLEILYLKTPIIIGMIIGKIHPGSGLGDQLFTYITTRTIALDKGYDFGFVGKEFFRGKDFMQLDWGKEWFGSYEIAPLSGKLTIQNETKLWETPAYYDPEVNFIEDGTIIDATCAQDERYWGHRLNEIREWLKVEPLEMEENLFIVNFRGGEYTAMPDLFLPKEYWQSAFDYLLNFYKLLKIEFHTDDIESVEKMFNPNKEELRIIKDIALNWRSVRYAKHLILSNSAFGILPALLNENVKEVVAPRYWARRNIKQWSMPSNYYKKFTYV